MAGVQLGFLKYVLGLDTLQFRKGISQSDADLAKMQKSFAARGKQLQTLGKSMALFVTAPLIGLATKGLHEAERMAAAMGQVDAALKSTGGAAGVAAGQLKKAAESFELHSLFESEDVLRDVSARLLAFGNVTGGTFTRAQQVILDFATRTKRDLGDATTVIGKALADPTKAAGALRRAGVVLTQSQQDLIKSMVASGNVAGAQALILATLETKYRGAAQAAADTDPWHKSHVAFKQLAETVGNAILPLIPPLSNAIAAVAKAFTSLSPATQKWVIIIGGVAAVLGPVLVGVGALITIISGIAPVVSAVAAAMGVLASSEAIATAASLALDVALSPVILVIGAIALAVGAAYLAWKNWDKIKPIVVAVYTAVKTFIIDKIVPLLPLLLGPIGAIYLAWKNWDRIVPVVRAIYTAVKTWLVDKLNVVWGWIKGKIGAVADWFKWLYDKIVGHSYVPDLVDGIQTHFARLDKAMVDPAKKATAATAAAFKTLKDDVSTLLDQLFPELAQARDQMQQLELLRKGIAAGTHPEGDLVAAQARVLGADTVDIAGGDQSLFPDGMPDLQSVLDTMPKIVDSTNQWKDVLGEIGTQLLSRIGDDISGIIDGSMKLKDLWKDLLAFGIQTLLSPNGPLAKLIPTGGARASGGPVLGGSAYLVGERGPEIFMPSSSGRIISNDNSRRMAGRWGGGAHVEMTVITNDANSFGRSEGQITRALRRKLG